ncbi:MAG: lipid II flippase MurJ, partial [Rhodospirillaceae bacterium]|nr:lipid II flippase MurJ [Rhodospirillaceae bacterium]
PTLSRQIRAGEEGAARDTQNRGLELGMLFTLPAAAGLALLSLPIVTSLFARGAFDADAADQTATALAAYAAGLPAFVMIKVFQPGFFARQDTKTPVKIGAATVVLNLILNLILMQYLAHVGLALATAIASWANMAFLCLILTRRGAFSVDQRATSRLVRIVAATAVMALGLVGATDLIRPWLDGPPMDAAGALVLLVFGGLTVYVVAASLFGAVRLEEIREALARRTRT